MFILISKINVNYFYYRIVRTITNEYFISIY